MSSHDREIYAGATLWGIHKDDLIIKLDGKNARNFASQGQQRSLALGLKLSEAAISASNTGESPVLLLDDVFSELDAERRSYLCERMKRGQVIMTACSDVDLKNENVNVIEVKNGTYKVTSIKDALISVGFDCIVANEEEKKCIKDGRFIKRKLENKTLYIDEMDEVLAMYNEG